MAARTRRASGPSRSRGGRRSTASRFLAGFRLPPHVARSLFGLTLLVVGAVTLIALLFPGAGVLNRYVDDILRPAFGQGALLQIQALLVAGLLEAHLRHFGNSNAWDVEDGYFVVVPQLA